MQDQSLYSVSAFFLMCRSCHVTVTRQATTKHKGETSTLRRHCNMTGREDPLDAAWIAIKNNDEETLTTVVSRDPQVVLEHYRNDPSMLGWTLLHYAAFLDRPRLVTILLNRGADHRALSGEEKTPLQMLITECKDKENSRSYGILVGKSIADQHGQPSPFEV